MRRALAALASAFGYFSVLPVGAFARSALDAESLAFLPLVGAVIGVIAGLLAELSARFAPPFVVAAVALATLWVLSGALHVDGFLDCCDALFAQVTPARRLQILKDPGHGTFALVGMTLLTLAWLAVLQLPIPPWSWPLLLGLTSAIARTAAVMNVWVAGNAYNAGGHPALAQPPNALVLSCMAATIEVIVALRMPPVALALLPLAALVSFWLGKFASRRFGGLTGDSYGFIITVLEPWIFLSIVMLLRR